MVDDDDEIDPATGAQLSRWFDLPSFEQLAERAPPALPADDDDAELVARRAAQARATAAVDPVLSEALYARGASVERLLRLREPPRETLDPSISALDPVLLARADAIEPRIVELPMQLRDALSECTPQALLRDLHRPALDFPYQLEVDPELAATATFDHAAEIRAALGRVALELPEPASRAIAADLEPIRSAVRAPWALIRTPTRRVTE